MSPIVQRVGCSRRRRATGCRPPGVVAALALVVSLPAAAGQNNWIGPPSGQFHDPANWSEGVVPGVAGASGCIEFEAAPGSLSVSFEEGPEQWYTSTLIVRDGTVTLDLYMTTEATFDWSLGVGAGAEAKPSWSETIVTSFRATPDDTGYVEERGRIATTRAVQENIRRALASLGELELD